MSEKCVRVAGGCTRPRHNDGLLRREAEHLAQAGLEDDLGGVLPCRFSQVSKSLILTVCVTSGCLTFTVTSVRPVPISPTQS